MWFLECDVKSQGMKKSQSKLVAKSKLKLVKTNDLLEGEWFYQVFMLNAVRRLKFTPSDFRNPIKYRRELDQIGVWLIRTDTKKIKKKSISNLKLKL